MRRDDAKNRILTGHDAPAVIQYQERLQKMEGELAAMSDPSSPTFNPDAVENKKKELERFRNASRLVTAEESGPMALAEFRAKEAEERATIRMAHEKEMAGVRAGSQKELQERRAKRSAMSAKLKVDLEDIDKKYDLDILSAFNDPNKKAKLQADKRSEQAAVWNKYNESFDNEDGSGVPSTPATTAPAAINKFRFDPSTYDIVK
jgi:actin-related protein